MTISEVDVAHWRQWIGQSESRTETIASETLRRYAAALGETYETDGPFPSLGHWAFFLAAPLPDELGGDGHVKRGGFLPPVPLPRRMFAATDIRFHAPLDTGTEAHRTARIANLTHKTGRSGNLVLVDIAIAIEQAGSLRIEETQTVVYRDEAGTTPPVEPAMIAERPEAETWRPNSVDLFRFSAVTFNSHRIHYDLPYATAREGYPGLVVHGPFTAARLFGLAQRGRPPIRQFAMRAQAPLFADQPILLTPGTDEGRVEARRCDGTVAMTARFEV